MIAAPITLILYVNDVATSCGFYTPLFEKAPLEQSVGFAMYQITENVMFGLWKRSDVMPTVDAHGASSELAVVAPSAQAVDEMHTRWSALGVAMVQAPVAMDFGYTFTAVDPDGHRLRVFSLPTPS